MCVARKVLSVFFFFKFFCFIFCNHCLNGKIIMVKIQVSCLLFLKKKSVLYYHWTPNKAECGCFRGFVYIETLTVYRLPLWSYSWGSPGRGLDSACGPAPEGLPPCHRLLWIPWWQDEFSSQTMPHLGARESGRLRISVWNLTLERRPWAFRGAKPNPSLGSKWGHMSWSRCSG